MTTTTPLAPPALSTDSLNAGPGMIDRRALLMLLGAGAFAAFGATSWPAFAQSRGPAEVPIEELMKAGDLPELSIGPADAKVTVVEYASMTCGHCKAFHTAVYPQIKSKYIDTGKIRFIFREFPLDNPAFAASMLTRCAGGEKTLQMVSVLFETQMVWAADKQNVRTKLFDVARQAGFTAESYEKCLTDQALLDKLKNARERASTVIGVNATPTFFINGKRLQEPPTIEGFDKVLEPLLK